MGNLVVLDRHLCLTLTEIKYSSQKERRQTPPYLGFETIESHAIKAPVQNEYAEANPLSYQAGRLVSLCGFKGCLFSHSGSPSSQALLEICN